MGLIGDAGNFLEITRKDDSKREIARRTSASWGAGVASPPQQGWTWTAQRQRRSDVWDQFEVMKLGVEDVVRVSAG